VRFVVVQFVVVRFVVVRFVVRFVVTEWCRDSGTVRAVTALLATAAAVALDRSNSDIANQVCLLVVVLAAAGLAAAIPHRWLLAGSIPVTALVVAHLVYAAGVVVPGDATHPAGYGGALTLFVLLVVTLPVAGVSAAIRRNLNGQSGSRGTEG